MDTASAIMMGALSRGKEQMVFDWDKAAEIIRERKPERAWAGLNGDMGNTGGEIFAEGKPVTDDYTYLASTWCRPVLVIIQDEDEYEEEKILCYRMQHEVPDWDCHTKWPDSALDILNEKN